MVKHIWSIRSKQIPVRALGLSKVVTVRKGTNPHLNHQNTLRDAQNAVEEAFRGAYKGVVLMDRTDPGVGKRISIPNPRNSLSNFPSDYKEWEFDL